MGSNPKHTIYTFPFIVYLLYYNCDYIGKGTKIKKKRPQNVHIKKSLFRIIKKAVAVEGFNSHVNVLDLFNLLSALEVVGEQRPHAVVKVGPKAGVNFFANK